MADTRRLYVSEAETTQLVREGFVVAAAFGGNRVWLDPEECSHDLLARLLEIRQVAAGG